jgi:nicotinamide riboside transporter PnuC
MHQLLNIAGFLGAGLLVLAYFCITMRWWKSNLLAYQGTNFVATSLLIVYSFSKLAYANVLLNAFMISVSIIGLYVWWRTRRRALAAHQPRSGQTS